MTRKGCDYAWGRPSIDSLKAAGITFACRYLSYGPAVGGKNLELGEAARLRSAGIDVVSNWEWYGDWSHDYSGGYTTGRRHALDADPMHRDRGGPAGRPIYFSTDFNPTTAQLPTVGDYARGNASAISLARTGAYGGYRAIKYLFDNHLITWGWQTYAWSTFSDDPSRPELAYLHWDPRAQLRQTKNGVLIGGVDCDIDYATVDDFGQWDGDEMNVADSLRLKLLAEMWNPTRDEWAKAGGDPARFDALVADGSDPAHPNVLAGTLSAVDKNVRDLIDVVQMLRDRPTATIPPEQIAALADRVGAVLVARTDNPLDLDDLPTIVQGVKQALSEVVAAGAGGT